MRHRTRAYLAVWALAACAAVQTETIAQQLGDSGWTDNAVGAPGLSTGDVRAMAVFDAGAGPMLYAAGAFETSLSPPFYITNLYRWNGTAWNVAFALGQAQSLLAANGLLYMGVRGIGSVPAGLMIFNGATWSVADGGVTGTSGTQVGVYALAAFGGEIYAGGDFTAVKTGISPYQSVATNNIARWNGLDWAPVGLGATGGGLNGPVYALKVFDPDGPTGGAPPALYAGGSFTTVVDGGALVYGIARWDGTSWSPMDSGLGAINALEVFDDGDGPKLYAAGVISGSDGPNPFNNIAKWDGTHWKTVGFGLTGGVVNCLHAFSDGVDENGPSLFAGGTFNHAGTTVTQFVARWDGEAWSPLGSGMASPNVQAMTDFASGGDRALYLGGSFTSAGNLPAKRVARWNGCTLVPLQGGVRNRALLPAVMGGLISAPQVTIGGSAARDVEVYGTNTVGTSDPEYFEVFYTAPAHAKGAVTGEIDVGPYAAPLHVEYTDETLASMDAVRDGVLTWYRELFRHGAPDGSTGALTAAFRKIGPKAGAIAEVALHGILHAADASDYLPISARIDSLLTELWTYIEQHAPAGFPHAAVRPITLGQVSHYPAQLPDDTVLYTAANGTLALTDGTTSSGQDESLTGGALILPYLFKDQSNLSLDSSAFANPYGWYFTLELDPPGPDKAKGMQLVDLRHAKFGGAEYVATRVSVPLLTLAKSGTAYGPMRLDKDDLAYIYVHPAVIASLPAPPGTPSEIATEWVVSGIYRINVDGTQLSDNIEKPALVVRQTIALTSEAADVEPLYCVDGARVYPGCAVTYSVPDPEGNPFPANFLRVDHRFGFSPQKGKYPLNNWVAGVFTDKDDIQYWVVNPLNLSCVALPLWCNLFSDKPYAMAGQLPAATVAPVLLSGTFSSFNHDNIHLHHVHPDEVNSWTQALSGPLVEAPGSFNGTIHMHWRWSADFGPAFGSGKSLIPPDQGWILGLAPDTVPEDPLPDFKSVLTPGGAFSGLPIQTAEKVLFVGCGSLGLVPDHQIETMCTGFAYALGTADTFVCTVYDFLSKAGGYTAVQSPGLCALVSLAKYKFPLVADVSYILKLVCGSADARDAPPPTSTTCNEVEIAAALAGQQAPISLAAGPHTVTFSVGAASHPFVVSPSDFTIASGYELVQPIGQAGSSLVVDIQPAARQVKNLPVIVHSGAASEDVVIRIFHAGIGIATTHATTVPHPGAPFLEGMIDVDPGQPFDHLVLQPVHANKEFGIGHFLLCDTVVAPGDLDGDGDVDMDDVAVFSSCASGAGVPVGEGCAGADLDHDGDADCDDLILLAGLAGGLGTLPDADGDGVPDACDNAPTVFNPSQADCDGDGFGDAYVLSLGLEQDSNGNGIPDNCDIAAGVLMDCNDDGLPDAGQVASGNLPDCNGNGVPDSCDITSGFSADTNANGIPDECEVGQWKDLDHALTGAQGLPLLVGSGTLIAGDLTKLELTNALGGSSATLVAGLTQINAPFKGGVMIPHPDLVLFGLPTGPHGDLSLSATWPAGVPAGLMVYFQFWIADAAGPHGASASNGVSAKVP